MSKINLTENFKKLEQLLGKKTNVQVIVSTAADCAACAYDPISESSVDPQCPVCGGRGKVYTEKKVRIPAFIQWDKQNETFTSGGVNQEAAVNLYVDYRTVANFKRFLNGRSRLFIDNVQYEIVSSTKTGIYNTDMLIYTCQKVEK